MPFLDRQAWVVEAAFVLTTVLAVVVLAISVFLLVHHRWSRRHRRRVESAFTEAALFLAAPLVDGKEYTAALAAAQRRWGHSVVVSVLIRARLTLEGEPEKRAAASLEEIGEVDRLARLTGSRWVWQRGHAYRHLGLCGGLKARQALTGGLGDGHAEVRRAARRALLALRDSLSTDLAVASYLADPERDALADRWFFGLLAQRSPRQLSDLAKSGRLHARECKQALEALADAGHPAVVPLALVRADDGNAELRATAARALGKVHSPKAIPVLTALLSDPEWFVRATAARSLGDIECGEAGRRALAHRLSDADWWVRNNAAASLSRQGDAGLEMVLGTLASGDARARAAALPALCFSDLSPRQVDRLGALLDREAFRRHDRVSVALLRANPAFERL